MGNREENLSKLRSLKSEKDKRMKRKQVIDAELRDLSQQLQKKVIVFWQNMLLSTGYIGFLINQLSHSKLDFSFWWITIV